MNYSFSVTYQLAPMSLNEESSGIRAFLSDIHNLESHEHANSFADFRPEIQTLLMDFDQIQFKGSVQDLTSEKIQSFVEALKDVRDAWARCKVLIDTASIQIQESNFQSEIMKAKNEFSTTIADLETLQNESEIKCVYTKKDQNNCIRKISEQIFQELNRFL